MHAQPPTYPRSQERSEGQAALAQTQMQPVPHKLTPDRRTFYALQAARRERAQEGHAREDDRDEEEDKSMHIVLGGPANSYHTNS